jgi:hypothetical protein
MRKFFDTIFYQSYIVSVKANKKAEKDGIPWHMDAIFNAIWDITLIQVFTIVGCVNMLIAIFGLREMISGSLLYVWGGIFVTIYLYNEFYYRRSRRYKTIIRRFSNDKYKKVPLNAVLIFSLAYGFLSVVVMKQG